MRITLVLVVKVNNTPVDLLPFVHPFNLPGEGESPLVVCDFAEVFHGDNIFQAHEGEAKDLVRDFLDGFDPGSSLFQIF
jgi:hypothetical protein